MLALILTMHLFTGLLGREVMVEIWEQIREYQHGILSTEYLHAFRCALHRYTLLELHDMVKVCIQINLMDFLDGGNFVGGSGRF